MHPSKIIPLALLLLLPSCALHKPVTYMPVPTVGNAKAHVIDSKDFLSRARGTNDEIDIEIRKLLESTTE